MKKKNPTKQRQATRKKAGVKLNPAGAELLRNFISELQSGVIQRTSTTLQIASAFGKILAGEMAAPHALGLVRPRGRQPRSAEGAFFKLPPKIWFLFRRLEAGRSLNKALEDTAEHFNLDERALEKLWTKVIDSKCGLWDPREAQKNGPFHLS